MEVEDHIIEEVGKGIDKHWDDGEVLGSNTNDALGGLIGNLEIAIGAAFIALDELMDPPKDEKQRKAYGSAKTHVESAKSLVKVLRRRHFGGEIIQIKREDASNDR